MIIFTQVIKITPVLLIIALFFTTRIIEADTNNAELLKNQIVDIITEHQKSAQNNCCADVEKTFSLFDDFSKEFISNRYLGFLDEESSNCQTKVGLEPIFPFRKEKIDFILEFHCNFSQDTKYQLLISFKHKKPKLIGLCQHDNYSSKCDYNLYSEPLSTIYKHSKCKDYKNDMSFQKIQEYKAFNDAEALYLARELKEKYFVDIDLAINIKNELQEIRKFGVLEDSEHRGRYNVHEYPGLMNIKHLYAGQSSRGGIRSGPGFGMKLKPNFATYFEEDIPNDLDCINHFWYFSKLKIDGYRDNTKAFPNWEFFLFIEDYHAEQKFRIEYQQLPYIEPLSDSSGASTFSCSSNLSISKNAKGQRIYIFADGWGDCPSGCTDGRYAGFVVQDDKIKYLGTVPSWKIHETQWLESCQSKPLKLLEDYFEY